MLEDPITELTIAMEINYFQMNRAEYFVPIAVKIPGRELALAKHGDLDAAIEAAEQLVVLEPDEPLSHTNLSRILMQKGLIPEAEDAKARAMNLQMKARR